MKSLMLPSHAKHRYVQMLVLSLIVSFAQAFTFNKEKAQSTRSLCKTTALSKADYDNIPPKDESLLVSPSNLPSVFDVSTTPAGMRGEAVRSAIRSGRCIAWNLGGTPLQQGWIKVEGHGTVDFLNNKLSQTFSASSRQFKEGCLLNGKGRVVDRIGVASISSDCAYMLTSPGHAGSALFQRLDPLVFPLDRVRLRDCSDRSKIITVASIKSEHAQQAIEAYVVPLLNLKTSWNFPKDKKCAQFELKSGALLTLLPTAILPDTAASGYTIVLENDEDNLGQVVWNNLIGEQSPDGPIEIGALEFDTLRIEGGMPLFGRELLASNDKDATTTFTPPSPLELHWDTLIDMNKGCYLGQEGVASIVKNPRGPPRLLYQVVFDYEGNAFDSESHDDPDGIENLTKLPEVGSDLFVLGSQNTICVGTLTSVAEPSGTGDPNMQGLALVKRADSILKSMKELGLEIDRSLGKEPFADDPLWNDGNADIGSAMVQPPPMDPLDGMEVVVKDTFTVGVLRSIPCRRYRLGQNMFADIGEVYDDVEPGEGEVTINRVQKKWNPEVEAALDALFEKQERLKKSGSELVDGEGHLDDTDLMSEADEAELERAMVDVRKAQADADAAAAEAQRKIAKMEMLKKRADEALERRKEQQRKAAEPVAESQVDEKNASAAEAKRKAEKVAMLQKQAEEAMARRKAKQNEKRN